MILQPFYPDLWVDSAYGIPYETLCKRGIAGLIFDVDNTLAFHGAPADEKARELFSYLRDLGMRTCLLSNNKEPRVKAFGMAVGSPYVFKGGKPGVRGYEKAMEQMGTVPANTAAVGDQLFTDILGANRAGLYSILVSPMNPREEIQIVLKRYLEKPILGVYRNSHPGEPVPAEKSGRWPGKEERGKCLFQ